MAWKLIQLGKFYLKLGDIDSGKAILKQILKNFRPSKTPHQNQTPAFKRNENQNKDSYKGKNWGPGFTISNSTISQTQSFQHRLDLEIILLTFLVEENVHISNPKNISEFCHFVLHHPVFKKYSSIDRSKPKSLEEIEVLNLALKISSHLMIAKKLTVLACQDLKENLGLVVQILYAQKPTPKTSEKGNSHL